MAKKDMRRKGRGSRGVQSNRARVAESRQELKGRTLVSEGGGAAASEEAKLQKEESIKKLQGEQPSLFDDFKKKAAAYLELTVNSANFSNHKEVYSAYKASQKALQENMSEIRRFHGASVVTDVNVNEISEKVNAHERKIKADLNAVNERIKKATLKAAAEISGHDIDGAIKHVAGAFGVPVGLLAEARQREALTTRRGESELVKLDGSGALVGKNGQQLALKDALNQPVAALSAETQAALVQAVLRDLANSAAPAERGIITQLEQAIIASVDGLSRGELTHMTLAAVVDGKVVVESTSIRELLRNPLGAISTLGQHLFMRGVREENVLTLLTPSRQAQVLKAVDGLAIEGAGVHGAIMEQGVQIADPLRLLTDTVVEQAREITSLTRIFKTLGVPLPDEEPVVRGTPLDGEKVLQVLLAMGVAGKAAQLAQDPNASLALTGEEQRLLSDMFGGAAIEELLLDAGELPPSPPEPPTTPSATLPASSPTEGVRRSSSKLDIKAEEAEPIDKLKGDIDGAFKDFLDNIESRFKGEKKKYQDASLDLSKALRKNKDEFDDGWKKPGQNRAELIKALVDGCSNTIEESKPKFEEGVFGSIKRLFSNFLKLVGQAISKCLSVFSKAPKESKETSSRYQWFKSPQEDIGKNLSELQGKLQDKIEGLKAPQQGTGLR